MGTPRWLTLVPLQRGSGKLLELERGSQEGALTCAGPTSALPGEGGGGRAGKASNPCWRDPLAGPSPFLMASKPAAGASPGEKRKRVVLTEGKMDICRRLEGREQAGADAGVQRGHVHPVRHQGPQGPASASLLSSDSDKALAQRRTLHTPKLEHLDRVLYEWFLVKRSECPSRAPCSSKRPRTSTSRCS